MYSYDACRSYKASNICFVYLAPYFAETEKRKGEKGGDPPHLPFQNYFGNVQAEIKKNKPTHA